MQETGVPTAPFRPARLDGGAPDRSRVMHRSFAAALALVLGTLAGCAPEATDPAVSRPGESVRETWNRLLETEDSRERTANLAAFAASLEPEHAAVVEELATDFHRRHRAIDDLILVNAWARLDPLGAAERAMLAQATIAEAARADTIREWAEVDPIAATAGLAARESAVERALVIGWYESGQPGLEDYIFQQGVSRSGQNMLATYAAEIVADAGPDALVAWMDGIRERTDLPMILLVHVHRKGISALVRAGADRAIAYCDLHCDKPYADSARARLTDRLSLTGQGETAMRWLARSEDAEPDERGRAGRIALRGWMREAPEEALAWADASLEANEGAAWFVPLGRLALVVHTRRNPERALDWVPILPDEQEREDALVRIGRRWLELDAEAGEAWIESSPLDEDARTRARTPAKRRSTKPPAPPIPGS